ncbi:hypothetical protein NBRC10513_001772 [Rhodotorula toruloides]|uniref:CCT-gamma n=1 Tax=Rhodotorula toruloides TaxID=5286 RepID=A0A2T0A4P0_RHOTO|nr:TCP-1/cpn60 chaperonin family-domain containing protein [Rhodotorula toruloides]
MSLVSCAPPFPSLGNRLRPLFCFRYLSSRQGCLLRRQSDVGTKCGLFYVEELGDECFTFLTKCQDPKACTILLRGPSKDGLHEVDRNLADAMAVARNVVFDPRLAPGGGATEMAISVGLAKKARAIEGVQGWPMRAVSDAMEVIPRTLVQNCGGNAIRTLTALRAKHAAGEHSFGVDGETGKVVDMKEYGLYESAAVKVQTLKTAIESACLLLRVDDIVSAKRPQGEGGPGRRSPTGKPAQMRKTDNMVAAD